MGISNLKIAVVVAQDRNINMIARKAGTGRIKAEEIDTVIGEYIHPSSLLCTATNYKKIAKNKGLQHESVNEHQKQRIYHIKTLHLKNEWNKCLFKCVKKLIKQRLKCLEVHHKRPQL